MTARPARLLAAATALLLAAGTGLVLAPAADAATYSVTNDPIRAAGGWLSTQFVDGSHLPSPDGDHFDFKYGEEYFANYGENADAVFGLAAAKTAEPAARRALAYLGANFDSYAGLSDTEYGPYDGSVAKTALAAIVLGDDPTAFPTADGPIDLIAKLKQDECPADATTCEPGAAANIYASISESFAMLAQARGGRGAEPSAAAVSYFTSLQCDDGGFTAGTTACGDGDADIDSTSYAIMALQALGDHDDELASAAGWLADQQSKEGYWLAQGIPNTNSTGLAAAALAGAGENVTAARKWLRQQQVGAGSHGAGALRYDGKFTPSTTSAASPSVFATAQGLVGLVDGGSLATVTADGSTDALYLFAPSGALSKSTVSIGESQTASGAGFVAGEKVRVVLHSTPVTVATALAGADGSVNARFTIPASVGSGAHTVVLTGLTSGLSVVRPLTVRAAAASGGGTDAGSGSAGAPAAGPSTDGADPIAATGLDGPRVLRESVGGGVLLLLGAALVVAGRRRRVA